jgi:lactobin A/cerein 7B family class IIb bacteriocin
MANEMRTLSDAEVDQVAGGIIAVLIALAVGGTVAGGAARRVSEGDDQ